MAKWWNWAEPRGAPQPPRRQALPLVRPSTLFTMTTLTALTPLNNPSDLSPC